MSQTLYRKYRPRTFNEIVGQKHIVETLKNAVGEHRVAHAYLFSGSRGTGKTTMARILAKALLCEDMQPDGPCGTCTQCVDIAEGDHPDVSELDAASRTGVENVREEIIGRVDFAPVRGQRKIYIIDEVHMLSTAAFNALLKTLEEPPSHVTFVLCTTDPQKVPETIRSRCQHFEFHRIPEELISEHLLEVAKSEGMTVEKNAADLIAARSCGGMRDALTTLEQLMVFDSGNVTEEDAKSLLGEVGDALLAQVSTSIAKRDVAACFKHVEELSEAGRDLTHFTREFIAYMRDVYVISVVGDGSFLGSDVDLPELRLVAERMGSTDRIARILTILADLSREMRYSSDQRLSLEIAFTRMARPDSDLTLEALSERIGELELALERQKFQAQRPAQSRPQVAEKSAAASVSEPIPPQKETVVPQSEATLQVKDEPATPAPVSQTPAQQEVAKSPKKQEVKSQQPQQEQEEDAFVAPEMPPSLVQRSWDQLKRTLMKEAPSRGVLVQSAHAVMEGSGKLRVELPAGTDFAKTMLEKEDTRKLISAQIERAFGKKYPWYVVISGESSHTNVTPSAPQKATVHDPKPESVSPLPEAESKAAPESEAQSVSPVEPEPEPQPEASNGAEDNDDNPPVDIYEADAQSSADEPVDEADLADMLSAFGNVTITDVTDEQ